MVDTGVSLISAFWILLISLATTVVAEAGNYYLIYRKQEYKDLNKEIDTLVKKIGNQKEDGTVKAKKKKNGSILETRLATVQRDLTTMKFKSGMLVGLFMIVTVSSLGNYFQGIPVARLPFVPFSLLTSLTHRGLVGDDLTECSYIFIYVLASYIFRTNIVKICGFETNNKANAMLNPFGMTYPNYSGSN